MVDENDNRQPTDETAERFVPRWARANASVSR